MEDVHLLTEGAIRTPFQDLRKVFPDPLGEQEVMETWYTPQGPGVVFRIKEGGLIAGIVVNGPEVLLAGLEGFYTMVYQGPGFVEDACFSGGGQAVEEVSLFTLEQFLSVVALAGSAQIWVEAPDLFHHLPTEGHIASKGVVLPAV